MKQNLFKIIVTFSLAASMVMTPFLQLDTRVLAAEKYESSEPIGATDDIVNKIPDAASKLVENELDAICKVSDIYREGFGLRHEVCKADVYVGKPFVMFDVDEMAPQEIYHFPIINKNTTDVELVVNVMGTTDGYTYDISTDFVDNLNDVKYGENECIFYTEGENVVAESADEETILEGNASDVDSVFSTLPYEEKIEEISELIDDFEKTDVHIKYPEGGSFIDGYVPSVVTTDVGTGKKCVLHNKQGQGKYGICWAASITTIANYRQGLNLNAYREAKDILNLSDTDLKDDSKSGQTIQEAQSHLLSRYGISYIYEPKQLGWDSIKSNIGAGFPIYMSSGYNDKSGTRHGHATTLFAYRKVNGVLYIVFWNSGLSGGNGAQQVVKYNASSTSYSYDAHTFTWNWSLSQRK